MPDKHVGAPGRYCKFSREELQRQRGITKSANIPKFSHHPPSYLPSLRLFPRLLTPAGDFCSQREAFPVYITLPSSRQPTLLGLHPPKTLVRVPGIWNRRNKSNIKYSYPISSSQLWKTIPYKNCSVSQVTTWVLKISYQYKYYCAKSDDLLVICPRKKFR